jgi:hypothetical protein
MNVRYGDSWASAADDGVVGRNFNFRFITDYDEWFSVGVYSLFSFNVYAESNGYKRLEYTDYQGWSRTTYRNDSWLEVFDDGYRIALPLDYLSQISVSGDPITKPFLFIDYGSTVFHDYFTPAVINYQDITLLKSDIVVDGDPSDWSGFTPVLVDAALPHGLSSTGADSREMYVATSNDGSIMYFMFKFSGPFSSWVSTDLIIPMIYLDSDGDGVVDRSIMSRDNGIYLSNYDTGVTQIISISSNLYNRSASAADGVLEFSFDLSYLSLPSNVVGFMGGDSKVVMILESVSNIGRIYYNVCEGGFPSKIIYMGRQWMYYASNPNIASFDGLTVKANLTQLYSVANYDVHIYDNNPLPYGFVDCIPRFYYLLTPLGNVVESPIQVNITYSDADLKKYGIIEDFLAPYYYNWTTQSYQQFKEYTVDKRRNIVSIWVYAEEAGMYPIIVLGQPMDASKRIGKEYRGMSSAGPAKLVVNLKTGEGYLEVTTLPLMVKEKYRIVFSVEVNNNMAMVLKGTIAVEIGGIELRLPITIYIDKATNKATMVGAVSFITF